MESQMGLLALDPQVGPLALDPQVGYPQVGSLALPGFYLTFSYCL